jgi:hypothetical protein
MDDGEYASDIRCRLAYVEGTRKEVEERINEILSETNDSLHTFHPMLQVVGDNQYKGLVSFVYWRMIPLESPE